MLIRSVSDSISWFVLARMVFFVLLILVSFVIQQPTSIFLGSCFCAVYAISFVSFSRTRLTGISFSIIFCFFCFPSILSMNHGLSSIFYMLSTIAIFFAAKSFCQHSFEELLYCFRVVFGASIFGIGFVLFTYWGHPEPLGEAIPGSSTNGIPSYLIVLQVTLTVSNYLASKKLPIISPILTLVVAFFGLGRGSLIISALILLLSIFGNLLIRGILLRQRVFALLFIFVIVAIAMTNFDLLTDFVVDGTKLREGLVDPYRMEIFYQYINKIDAWSLIAGSDYAGTVISAQYDGNPHISLIRTHAYFGVFVFLIVYLSPFLIFISNRPIVDKIIVFLLIDLILFRALSEPILFPTLLDFFYFCLFFMFFKDRVVVGQVSSVR